MSASFGAVGVVDAPDASGWRLAHQTSTLKTASRTAAMRRLRGFMLSPLDEDDDAPDDHDQGNHNDIGVEKHVHLPLIHIEAAIFRFFRTNRDKIFIRREPVHNVQREIAIALETDGAVVEETRSADHNHATRSV